MEGGLLFMEYTDMENLLLNLEKLIEEIQERIEILDVKLDSEAETLQSQINNLRD